MEVVFYLGKEAFGRKYTWCVEEYKIGKYQNY